MTKIRSERDEAKLLEAEEKLGRRARRNKMERSKANKAAEAKIVDLTSQNDNLSETNLRLRKMLSNIYRILTIPQKELFEEFRQKINGEVVESLQEGGSD